MNVKNLDNLLTLDSLSLGILQKLKVLNERYSREQSICRRKSLELEELGVSRFLVFWREQEGGLRSKRRKIKLLFDKNRRQMRKLRK